MREGWRAVVIRDAAKLVRRSVFVRAGMAYPLLGMRWYGQGPFLRETVTADTAKAKVYFQVRAGDFIYNRMFAWKGSFGVVPERFDGYYVSGEFPVFEMVPGSACAEYINLVMCRPVVWDQILRASTGSTAISRNRWNETSFLEWELLLPPLAEQRRIVDLVDHIQDVGDRAEAEAGCARHLGNAIRATWFTDRLPIARPLRSVVEITNGRLRNPLNAVGPHMTRYMRTANVQDGRLKFDEPMYMNFTPSEQARYALRSGDVLVTEGSGSRASIGASCRWDGEIPGVVCFQNHLLRLRPLAGSTLSPEFVYEWALWSHRTGRFAEIATGTNILSLGVEHVAEMAIPVDEPEAVKAFVGDMRAIEEEERAARDLAASAAGFRSTLASALLSGGSAIPASYDRFLDGVA